MSSRTRLVTCRDRSQLTAVARSGGSSREPAIEAGSLWLQKAATGESVKSAPGTRVAAPPAAARPPLASAKLVATGTYATATMADAATVSTAAPAGRRSSAAAASKARAGRGGQEPPGELNSAGGRPRRKAAAAGRRGHFDGRPGDRMGRRPERQLQEG